MMRSAWGLGDPVPCLIIAQSLTPLQVNGVSGIRTSALSRGPLFSGHQHHDFVTQIPIPVLWSFSNRQVYIYISGQVLQNTGTLPLLHEPWPLPLKKLSVQQQFNLLRRHLSQRRRIRHSRKTSDAFLFRDDFAMILISLSTSECCSMYLLA